MAFSATRFSEKQGFAGPGRSRQRGHSIFSLQFSQVPDQSLNFRVAKVAKCRHSGARNAFPNHLRKRKVGEFLDFASPCDIGRAFPAAAVETVTAAAGGRK
jgi:hypothetical protein